MSERTTKIYAVILVGGKGKRLRPLSTDAKPKAFLSITKDRKTIFRRTIERIEKIIPPDNIVVVANRAHSELVRKDVPDIDEKNLILEPASRNTAPAVTLAALTLQQRQNRVIMIVLPADQYLPDEPEEEKYLDSIKRGIDFATDNRDVLLTLGIQPKFPSVELGYIKVNDPVSGAQEIYKVEKFVEKPDIDTAKEFVKSKKYLWNAGAFIFTNDSILTAVKRFAPDIYDGLENSRNMAEAYEKVPDISVDYAVMEKADKIYCVRGSYEWQDMGSFEILKSILKRESRDYVLEDGKITKIL